MHLLMVVVASVLLYAVGAAAAPTTVAAGGSKVVIIVGPSGSTTTSNKIYANRAAGAALQYTSNVVKVYTPNATWSKVKAAMNGAAVVVYFGRTRGWPSRYSTARQALTQDGFGLNPRAGHGDSTTRFYGEASIRSANLAPDSVVLLMARAYASGAGEPGRPEPTVTMARQRIDNYAAGFLVAGARAVVADSYRPMAVWYIRQIFGGTSSIDASWRAAPNSHGHQSTFTSTRIKNAYGRMDPVRVHSGFTRSIVGRSAATPAGKTPPAAPPPGTKSGPITVTRNNVTIDGVTIIGSTSPSGAGIDASGTSANPIRNLTIRNCTIKGFKWGILAEHVVNLVIQNCTIEDAYYAGIGIYSGIGGRIQGNTIRRIGFARTNMSAAQVENNAYGITLDRSHTSNLTTDPLSANFVISQNLVEDVPLWMGINLHAGVGIDIVENTVRRCPRAIFIAGDAPGPGLHHPANVNVLRNRLEQAVTKPGGTTSEIGITTAGLQGGSIIGNLISSTFAATIYDYAGDGNGPSSGVTISGNTTIR